MKATSNFQQDIFDDNVLIPGLLASTGAGDISEHVYSNAEMVDLDSYDRIIVTFSGKDSFASLLKIIKAGVDLSKVELWHHDVDGREGGNLAFDWPFMRDYCLKVAQALNLPIFYSWVAGGIETEMLKKDDYSKPILFETPDGLVEKGRDLSRAKKNTRLLFPQQSGSLQTRWCSSIAKIDVGRRALNHQPRFNNARVLFISGERRQESSNRAKYFQLEPHYCDRRSGRLARHIDHWRPVLNWSEEMVWEALKNADVLAPVPYRLNFSRSSCQLCIFNDDRIWATLLEYFPNQVKLVDEYEQRFGKTIDRGHRSVLQRAKTAKPLTGIDPIALQQASKSEYLLPVFANSDHPWELPSGAFGTGQCGSW